MFAQTTALLVTAHTLLVQALGTLGDNRVFVARAEYALHEVGELASRNPGAAYATLTRRESLADSVVSVIHVARIGHTSNYNTDTLRGAVAILEANGYTA